MRRHMVISIYRNLAGRETADGRHGYPM